MSIDILTHRISTDWLDDVRDMALLDTFSYIDKEGREFIAEAGSLIDGASIPRILWTISGCPFTGKYRKATVMHDAHCKLRIYPSRVVHDMFWDLMIATGVDKDKADYLWFGVVTFGPDWELSVDKKTRLRYKEQETFNRLNDEVEW